MIALAAAAWAADGQLVDPVRPRSQRIWVSLDPARPETEGHTILLLDVRAETRTFLLHADELELSDAAIRRFGKRPHPVTIAAAGPGLVRITAEEPLAPGLWELDLRFRGVLHDQAYGLYRFAVDDRWYVASQFQPDEARTAWPCFDEPSFKIPFTLQVTVPDGNQVIANAPVAARNVRPAGLEVQFEPTEPIPSYALALLVGPYVPRPLGDLERTTVWTVAGHEDYADAIAEVLPRIDRSERGWFGSAPPWEKQDLIVVPEFAYGAMENPGAMVFAEALVPPPDRAGPEEAEWTAHVVAHEYAHLWFGDLVTMTWWDDLWLNESFATFASVLCQASATEYTGAWTTFANVEKSWAYRQDQLPSTHPVAADIPDIAAVEVNFDGITYAKGASVLKQLVAYVGLDPFLAGLRDYFAAHKFDNATFDDLLAALERSSGRDLSHWGAQWLKTTGINVMRPDFEIGDDGRFTRFAILQEGAAPGAGETRVHRMKVGVYGSDEAGKLVRQTVVELDVDGERTEVADLVGVDAGELILLNDDDLTYASIRLDPDSLRVATERISDIADPMPRTLIWSAAWEMTRQAEMTARAYIDLVSRGIATESEIGVVQRVLLQANAALGMYADPEWAREEGWPSFSARLLELARAAEAGSDHQLAFLNTLLTGVTAPDQHAVLRGLLDGDDPTSHGLPGLAVDADLRWRIVKALATAGVIDQPEIDAERERDSTAAGHRNAEGARAARPSTDAKAAAWQAAMVDDSLPNITVRAIAEGFAGPGQDEVLAPYADEYFATIADVWGRRSSEVAQTVVVGLYPDWDISDDGLARADQFLAGDHPPALRRLVLEGRDSVARALRAQRFDREGSR